MRSRLRVLLAALVWVAACPPAPAREPERREPREKSRREPGDRVQPWTPGARTTVEEPGRPRGGGGKRTGQRRRGRRRPGQDKWSALGEALAALERGWRQSGSARLFDGGSALRSPSGAPPAAPREGRAPQAQEPRGRWSAMRRPGPSAAPPAPPGPPGGAPGGEARPEDGGRESGRAEGRSGQGSELGPADAPRRAAAAREGPETGRSFLRGALDVAKDIGRGMAKEVARDPAGMARDALVGAAAGAVAALSPGIALPLAAGGALYALHTQGPIAMAAGLARAAGAAARDIAVRFAPQGRGDAEQEDARAGLERIGARAVRGGAYLAGGLAGGWAGGWAARPLIRAAKPASPGAPAAPAASKEGPAATGAGGLAGKRSPAFEDFMAEAGKADNQWGVEQALTRIKKDPPALAVLRREMSDPYGVNSTALNKALRAIEPEAESLLFRGGSPAPYGEALAALRRSASPGVRAALVERGFPLH